MNCLTHYFKSTGLLLLSLSLVIAQEVKWEPTTGELEEGRTERLRLIFEQCSPETTVQLPEVDGLQFGQPSQNRQMQVINFKVSQRYELIYPVQVSRRGKIEIPAFEVVTNKGVFPVAEATFTGVEASNGGGSSPGRSSNSKSGGQDAIKSFLKSQPNSVWVGQVVDLIYELYVSSRFEGNIAGPIEWKPTGATVEGWDDMQQNQSTFHGITYAGARSKTRAIFDDSAIGITFPPIQQKLQIRTGGSGFFSFPQMEDHSVKTMMGDFQLKPLPPAPPDFLKAVGQFKIKSTVVPQQVMVGEPVTWTLSLEGTGNWPIGLSLPVRDVSKSFRVIQPRATQTNVKNKLFEATLSEDVVLIPEKEGSYPLGPIRFVYFDPSAGSYKTIETEAITVTAKPSNRPPVQTQNYSGTSNSENSITQGKSNSSVSFDSVPKLPRDPIVGWSWGAKPLSRVVWFSGMILMIFGLFAVWVKNAYDHVVITEPHRQRRIALFEMKKALGEIERNSLIGLRAWRKATTEFLALMTVVPSPDEVAESIVAWGGVASDWKRLWEMSDERLFSKNEELNAEWLTLAQSAHRTILIPKLNRWSLFRFENLFPLIVTAFLMMSSFGVAEDFENLYRAGKWEEGKTVLKEKLKSHPSDGRAHSYLSLCLIQQNEWKEAYPYALAAWLLDPRDSDLRWNLELTRQQSQSPANGLESIYQNRWNPVGWASVFIWQLIAWIGMGLLFYSLYRELRVRYQKTEKRKSIWNLIGIGFGFMLLLISFWSWNAYGVCAHPKVMVVVNETDLRSIPADLEEESQSKKVPAGTVVLMKHEFLNWAKIKLSQNEEGWIRKSEARLLFKNFED